MAVGAHQRPAPDPVLGLTFAAARTKKIKLGTSVQVLPGRSPARVAKSWATLDALSGGRALPAFGLGIVHPVEQQAFGVERRERAAIFDEALPLIRRLWSEDAVDHDGTYFHYEGMTVLPKPAQAARRVARRQGAVGAAARRQARRRLARVVQHARRLQGRRATRSRTRPRPPAATIDDDHFGAMVFYTHDEIPERAHGDDRDAQPGADPSDLVAHGWPAVRELCERFVAVGFTKLVLVPFTEPDNWDDELAQPARGRALDPELIVYSAAGSALRLARRRGSGGGRSSSRATPMPAPIASTSSADHEHVVGARVERLQQVVLVASAAW